MGVAFFSQPLMTTGWVWLNRNYPNWMEMLDLKKSVRLLCPRKSLTVYEARSYMACLPMLSLPSRYYVWAKHTRHLCRLHL
jgi:hypothetical protein